MPAVARKNVYIIRSHTLACPRANLFRGIVKSAINQTAPGSAALASFAIIACSSLTIVRTNISGVTPARYRSMVLYDEDGHRLSKRRRSGKQWSRGR